MYFLAIKCKLADKVPNLADKLSKLADEVPELADKPSKLADKVLFRDYYF